MDAIDLKQKLTLFTKQFHPHLVAEGASLQVYLSKIQGELVMHAHEEGDELFYVVKGRMEMCFRDRSVPVAEGQIILVPRGVEHYPRTDPQEETHVLVVEHIGTTHTGKVQHERTVARFNRI